MMIPTIIGSLVVLAWWKSTSKGKWTPEREEMFLNALEHLTDPEKLRKLANEFDKHGLHVRAVVLRKRADLRALPPSTKRVHHEVYERAMKSVNVDAILVVAEEFEKLTATGAAQNLRAHALDVKHGRFNIKTRVKTPVEAKKEAEKAESVIEVVVKEETEEAHTNGTSEKVALQAVNE